MNKQIKIPMVTEDDRRSSWENFRRDIDGSMALLRIAGPRADPGWARKQVLESVLRRARRLARTGERRILDLALQRIKEDAAEHGFDRVAMRHGMWLYREMARIRSMSVETYVKRRWLTLLAGDPAKVKVDQHRGRLHFIPVGRLSDAVKGELRRSGWTYSYGSTSWHREHTDAAEADARRILEAMSCVSS